MIPQQKVGIWSRGVIGTHPQPSSRAFGSNFETSGIRVAQLPLPPKRESAASPEARPACAWIS